MDNINIFLCGIGGQGVVLAGKVISQVFYASKYDVKVTDVIGVGQRGGSVAIHIRIGKDVYAPLIKAGTLNYLIAFEKYEALRWKHLLADDGVMVVNDYKSKPNTVAENLETDIDVEFYFEQILNEKIMIGCNDILRQNRLSPKCINVLLIGIFSTFFSIDESVWIKKLIENIDEKYLSSNIEAFKLGCRMGLDKSERKYFEVVE